MENSKYYTPTIEEFHVGFEYEVKVLLEDNECRWLPFILKHPNYEWMNVHTNGEYRTFSVPEYVRVKYLDKEDIESLGWKYDKTKFEILEVFELIKPTVDSIAAKFILTLNTTKKFIDIEYIEEYLYTPTAEDSFTYRVFQGKIKNKSELKKLMQQLNITQL